MPKNKSLNKFDAFVLQMGPSLYRALLRYGVQNREAAFANMMRLLALESNYGTSDQAINNNNFGGVGFNPKTNSYYSYKDIDAFTDAYVKLMNGRYRKALDVYDPREYAKIVHGLGYFGYPNDPKKDAEALLEYLNNMATMISLNTALANHVRSNPDIYPREGFINGTPKSIYRPEQDKIIVPFWAPTLNIDPQEELKVELAPPTMIQRPQEEPEVVEVPTVVDKLKQVQLAFNLFGLDKDSKKKSSLPELIPDLDEYMKLEQENYFRDIMGIGDAYDNLYAYNSRLPKPLGYFKSGKVPKAILTVNNSNAEFVDRLKSNWRDEIWDWKGSGKAVTHKIAATDNIVYPNVLKVNGGLIDFTHPIWKGIVNPYWNAIKTGNYVEMDSEDDAKWFGPNYKKYYPSFKNGKLPRFDIGRNPII